MEKYGFIYIWFDKKRKMFYIGCHWGTEDDGYICSSTRMRNVYRRRPKDFKRRILKKYIPKKSLLLEEHKWLKLIKQEELGEKYYNYRNCLFGSIIKTEETKQKMKNAAKKGSIYWLGKFFTEKHRENLSKSHLGKFHTEDHKQNIGNSIRGRKHSSLSIQKMRKPKEKTICPHCGKIGGKGVMGKWHFDKCKNRGM